MENCVFDRGGRKCEVLSCKKCEKCSFRKTEEELKAGRDRAEKRLEKLPKEQHDAIQRKYYGLRRCSEVGE